MTCAGCKKTVWPWQKRIEVADLGGKRVYHEPCHGFHRLLEKIEQKRLAEQGTGK